MKQYISDEQIASVMTTRDFVESCDEAFRLYGLGKMVSPLRKEEVSREGEMDLFRLVMPGWWKGKFTGQKVIEERSDVKVGRLGSRTAVIELEDMRKGDRISFDAERITNMRTGAAGALGAKYLAKMPVRTAAILGTGRIAQALGRCIDVALAPETIRVTSRTAERRAAYQADVGGDLSCDLDMVADIEACIDGADAIFTSVPTPEPILFDVESHVHISVIGGDGRSTQLDPGLLTRRFVVPDHGEQVLKSGEFLALCEREKTPRWVKGEEDEILNIGHASLGHLEHLRGQGCIAYSSGLAIQDVHAAAIVWGKIREIK
ncbi:MAG: hypothetical protein F4Y79_04810 [Gemmatimonadetes bacterium]|nr:hypothetical protein [Gemmatimonadota bacterium]